MGPLPVSERGNRYILVVSDLFTKWVEAFPISNTLSTTLATVLVDEVICRYGVPSYLHSDQGANLCSEVVSCLCKLLNIHKTRTSAYHPQGNGQVERFNQTVESILSKMVQANQRNWDVQLPKALFAYRCSIHESTGFTPYHLNFGRSPRLPIDVLLGHSPLANRSTANSYPAFISSLHDQLKQSSDLARSCIQKQHDRHKDLHDQRSALSELTIGDCVWLYTPAVKPGQTKRLALLWRGPYTVLDRYGLVDYKIQLVGGNQTQVVHRDRLKLCHGLPSLFSSPRPNPQQLPGFPTPNVPQDDDRIGGYTSIPQSPNVVPIPPPRPQRNRHPPVRYGSLSPIKYLPSHKDVNWTEGRVV